MVETENGFKKEGSRRRTEGPGKRDRVDMREDFGERSRSFGRTGTVVLFSIPCRESFCFVSVSVPVVGFGSVRPDEFVWIPSSVG